LPASWKITSAIRNTWANELFQILQFINSSSSYKLEEAEQIIANKNLVKTAILETIKYEKTEPLTWEDFLKDLRRDH